MNPDTGVRRGGGGLVLAVLLAGCGSGDDPVLHVGDIQIWPMPSFALAIPQPRSVSIGPEDQVVVLDKKARVLLFDAEGNLMRQWRMPEFENGNPQGAAVLRDGRIAVADTHYYRVMFFDMEGNIRGSFGSRGKGPGQFEFPVSIVQDDQENLYVAEYFGNDRVQKFTRDGHFVASIGSPGTGPGQFQRPGGMVWQRGSDGVGRLFIADADNGRVQVYRDDGTFEQVFGDEDGSGPHIFDFPFDVAADAVGSIYVIEWQGNRLSKFNAAGTLLGRFGSAGSELGQFLTPWGIAVDSKGRIRVADYGNHRIVGLIP